MQCSEVSSPVIYRIKYLADWLWDHPRENPTRISLIHVCRLLLTVLHAKLSWLSCGMFSPGRKSTEAIIIVMSTRL